jgi:hypothetical protein
LLRQAQNGLTPVIRIEGRLNGGYFSSDISLGRTKCGYELQLPWVDEPTKGKNRLMGLRLEGARLTLVWRHPSVYDWDEVGKTFTEAATAIFKAAIERTALTPEP